MQSVVPDHRLRVFLRVGCRGLGCVVPRGPPTHASAGPWGAWIVGTSPHLLRSSDSLKEYEDAGPWGEWGSGSLSAWSPSGARRMVWSISRSLSDSSAISSQGRMSPSLVSAHSFSSCLSLPPPMNSRSLPREWKGHRGSVSSQRVGFPVLFGVSSLARAPAECV
jgi:hypothetical protein